ncbi:MAG: hypothetical protein JWM56_964 [Candidatus Peribacteria bacterium]|nr:hypothetical protein [Candidatus Peribacteria bacterium]
MHDCIFCKIVSGDSPSFTIWEDEKHMAFLSIFPNTPGFSVVIPKTHYPSYAFDIADDVLTDLVLASKKVGKLLDKAFSDVGRTGMIFEGFGVDHIHAKLIPMHGTGGMTEWKQLQSNVDVFFDQYKGYISSHDYKRAEDTELAAMTDMIRNAA